MDELNKARLALIDAGAELYYHVKYNGVGDKKPKEQLLEDYTTADKAYFHALIAATDQLLDLTQP